VDARLVEDEECWFTEPQAASGAEPLRGVVPKDSDLGRRLDDDIDLGKLRYGSGSKKGIAIGSSCNASVSAIPPIC
jgi:hypothetical protein